MPTLLNKLLFILLIGTFTACSTTVKNNKSISTKRFNPPIEQKIVLDSHSSAREEITLFSLGLLNIQYQWGSQKPDFGLDCSGLVAYVYQNAVNIKLPHKASIQAMYGREISIDELKAGDLLFFNTTGKDYSHVGIYIGENKFIHAPKKGDSVKVSLFQNYYKKKFQKAITFFS